MNNLPPEIQSELNRLKRYDDELSSIMYEDFKDWWQNSQEEWPEVARLVIEQQREEIEMLYKQMEKLAEMNRRLTQWSSMLEKYAD